MLSVQSSLDVQDIVIIVTLCTVLVQNGCFSRLKIIMIMMITMINVSSTSSLNQPKVLQTLKYCRHNLVLRKQCIGQRVRSPFFLTCKFESSELGLLAGQYIGRPRLP